MKKFAVAVGMSGTAFFAFSQTAISLADLKGTWTTEKSERESMVIEFREDQRFSYTYAFQNPSKKSPKQLPTTKDGGYQLGAKACALGDQSGNLWLAAGSTRCCLNAYKLGSMLVLDAIRAAGEFPFGLCMNRTMVRR